MRVSLNGRSAQSITGKATSWAIIVHVYYLTRLTAFVPIS